MKPPQVRKSRQPGPAKAFGYTQASHVAPSLRVVFTVLTDVGPVRTDKDFAAWQREGFLPGELPEGTIVEACMEGPSNVQSLR